MGRLTDFQFDFEDLDGVIGCFGTLLRPMYGCREAVVIGDYDDELMVRLTNNREVMIDRDSILIAD